MDRRQRLRDTRLAQQNERSKVLDWRSKRSRAPCWAVRGVIQGDFSLRALLTRLPRGAADAPVP